MHDGQVQPAVVVVVVIGTRRHMVGFHHLIALQGFQVNVEAPEPVQVLEHFLGGVAQGFAVVLLVAQGQRAVAVHAFCNVMGAPSLKVCVPRWLPFLYYPLLVGGAWGFYVLLWPLTESANALAAFV